MGDEKVVLNTYNAPHLTFMKGKSKVQFPFIFTRKHLALHLSFKTLKAKALDCHLALSKSRVKPKPTIDSPHSQCDRSMGSRVSRRTRGAELEPTMSRGRDAATGVMEKKPLQTCTDIFTHTVNIQQQHSLCCVYPSFSRHTLSLCCVLFVQLLLRKKKNALSFGF